MPSYCEWASEFFSHLHYINFMFSKSLTLYMREPYKHITMIHLHFLLAHFGSREFLFSSMYDNPLTPSPSNFKITHLKLYCARYLRCNFFTPFTRTLFHTHCLTLPSSIFYRLIKMRMNIIIVVLRPSDSKNLLWTVFFILFLFVVRLGLCLYILPKINELIMQLPHNFKQSFLFCSIIFYYFVYTISQVYFVHKMDRFAIVLCFPIEEYVEKKYHFNHHLYKYRVPLK